MGTKSVKISKVPSAFSKGDWKPIDMSKVYKNQEKQEAQDLIRYKKEIAKEEKRLEKLNCPACKSINKLHYCKRDSNGIIGPGSRSWLIEEYYICKDCGIHFSDLHKKEIALPYKGLW
jgi:transposase-like protein